MKNKKRMNRDFGEDIFDFNSSPKRQKIDENYSFQKDPPKKRMSITRMIQSPKYRVSSPLIK